MNYLKENILISNNNYAKYSNTIFSETIDLEMFNSYQNKNLKIIEKSQNTVNYINKKFYLSDGDIIFCKRDMLSILFSVLKNIQLKNISIIVHQTDHIVNKKSLKNMPNNIQKLYSINVKNDYRNVEPIPIGLSGTYSYKNLQEKDFNLSSLNFNIDEKINKLYLNFDINTNRRKRKNLIDYFSKFDWAFIETNIELSKYKKRLEEFAFVLCPQGNGIDTHRIWETLYSGSIPIVENHFTHKNLYDLPILFIEDFRLLTKLHLENFKKDFNIKNFNRDKLFLDFWINEIKTSKNNFNANKVEVEVSNKLIYVYIIKKEISKFITKIWKFFRYYLYKYF